MAARLLGVVVAVTSKLRKSLSVASLSLVGAVALAKDPEPVQKQIENTVIEKVEKNQKTWFFDSALLYYTEPDRVSAVEPVIEATKKWGEDRFWKTKLVLDSLTGSSANGATITDTVQTFTTPSGNSEYNIAPGEVPLDETFRDTRVALSSNYQWSPAEQHRQNYGVSFSNEYDYQSLSFSLLGEWDRNQNNTTFSAGISYAMDSIDPVGGAPIPLSTMQPPNNTQPKTAGTESKDTLDVLLGWTQVLSKKSLLVTNYSFSMVDGYTNDPYKLISIVNPSTGDTQSYIYEARPDERTKHSFYFLYKHYLNQKILNLSYRFYTDDWGINSHTLESSMMFFLEDNHRSYLEPSIRLYQQSEADFYYHSLPSNQIPNDVATADYRLGNMTTYTIGLKYGQDLEKDKAWYVRLSYYLQTGNPEPNNGIGSQTNVNLFPDVDAYMLQVGYTF